MGRTLMASLGCLVLAVASCAKASEDTCSRLLAEHNRHRVERGLGQLVVEERLCEYAQSHSKNMAVSGRLVHSSMSSLAMVFGNGNVGENIAWGQNSEEEVCEAWMNSPGHKSNILSKRYKKVGFGVHEDERGRKYWCVVFSA